MNLILSNFQSHEYSEIKIAKGITALLGANDVGKTAVVRALRWLFWNRPSGDSFATHWKNPNSLTKVKLVTDDGWIARVRSVDKNAYIINGQELNAIGHQVPQEIKQFFHVEPVNFQFQTDPPFLIGNSPGDRFEYLQKITRMGIVSLAEDLLRKRIRDINIEIANCNSQIERCENELSKFPDLESIKHEIDKLAAFEEELNNKKARLKSLEEKINEYYSVRSKMDLVQTYRDLSNDMELLENKLIEKQSLVTKLNQVMSKIREIKFLMVELSDLADTLQRLKKRWNEILPEECPVCGQPLNLKRYRI